MTDLSRPTLPGALPDKRQVAASFSRAAASYDSVAALQRAVGLALLGQLPADLQPERWLDLGSGTGHFSRALAERFSAATGVAVDIAEGMLRHAREQGGAHHHVAGDAERLPLRDDSVDLVFSSLAVQWCDQFGSVLSEARRVLRPGGVLAIDNTLWSGAVADPSVDDDTTQLLRDLNDALVADDRFDTVLLPLGDGLTLLRRR